MQKHLEGPLHGDAIAISRLDTLLTGAEKATARSKWLFNDVIENNAEKLVDRFRQKIEDFVKASLQDDSYKDTRTPHFMLVKDMSLAADDQDRYPMGKAGQQTIRPDQIETHFSAKSASPEAVVAAILESITAARLAQQAPGLKAEAAAPAKPEGPLPDGALNAMRGMVGMSIQNFIDGTVVPEMKQEEMARLKNNLGVLSKHDPQAAASMCRSMLDIKGLDEGLKAIAAEQMPKSMESFAQKDPQAAKIMAKAFIETADGNSRITAPARAFLDKHDGGTKTPHAAPPRAKNNL